MPLPLVLPQPYIPLSVEELGQVKDLNHWSNTNVRAFGRIRIRILEESLVVLRGVAEEAEEEEGEIWVDYGLVLDEAPRLQSGSLVQVLGELTLRTDGKGNVHPTLRAHIIRDFSGINPKKYHAAVAVTAPHCPINVKVERQNEGDPEAEAGNVSHLPETPEREDDVVTRDSNSSVDLFESLE